MQAGMVGLGNFGSAIGNLIAGNGRESLATSMSEHSHNRKLGEYLAEGFRLHEIKQSMGVLPEGYNTLQTVLYVAEKLHV